MVCEVCGGVPISENKTTITFAASIHFFSERCTFYWKPSVLFRQNTMSSIKALMWPTEETEIFLLGGKGRKVWKMSASFAKRNSSPMLFSQLISFCHSFFREGLFWGMVRFTCQNLLESLDGLLDRYQHLHMTYENLINLEWLR